MDNAQLPGYYSIQNTFIGKIKVINFGTSLGYNSSNIPTGDFTDNI